MLNANLTKGQIAEAFAEVRTLHIIAREGCKFSELKICIPTLGGYFGGKELLTRLDLPAETLRPIFAGQTRFVETGKPICIWGLELLKARGTHVPVALPEKVAADEYDAFGALPLEAQYYSKLALVLGKNLTVLTPRQGGGTQRRFKVFSCGRAVIQSVA